MGNLANALFEGEEESYETRLNRSKLWAFNQQIGGYDLNLADVNLGETVLLGFGMIQLGFMRCIFTASIFGWNQKNLEMFLGLC